MRADSGFYTHAVVAACRKLDVSFSITIRQHASLRNLIEAIPEDAWTPIPYWMEGAAAVVSTAYTPFRAEPNGSPARRAASPCISPSAGLGKPSSVAPSPYCEPCPAQPDGG